MTACTTPLRSRGNNGGNAGDGRVADAGAEETASVQRRAFPSPAADEGADAAGDAVGSPDTATVDTGTVDGPSDEAGPLDAGDPVPPWTDVDDEGAAPDDAAASRDNDN